MVTELSPSSDRTHAGIGILLTGSSSPADLDDLLFVSSSANSERACAFHPQLCLARRRPLVCER